MRSLQHTADTIWIHHKGRYILQNEDVCILIPTLNEAATIEQLIKDFRAEGFDNILVIDGHSTDKTAELAEAQGAKVVVQSGKGKGCQHGQSTTANSSTGGTFPTAQQCSGRQCNQN